MLFFLHISYESPPLSEVANFFPITAQVHVWALGKELEEE